MGIFTISAGSGHEVIGRVVALGSAAQDKGCWSVSVSGLAGRRVAVVTAILY